jgi:Regulator of chromosome condensation (RCC1) repeat
VRIATAFATVLVTGQVLFACASSSDDAPGPDPTDFVDSSTDASSSPPEAGPDAGSSDARLYDGATPKPLEIACEGEPCFRAISGNGGRHLCALLEDKSVRCWGRNTMDELESDGALGRGGEVSALEGATPAPVVGLPAVDRLRVGPNSGTCARTVDGQVYCWGRNDFGQLGQSPDQARLLVPTRIEGLPPVDEVELGSAVGCAITSGSRALYCWGTDVSQVFNAPHAMTGFRPPVKALAIGTWEDADTVTTLLEGDVLAATGQNLPVGDSSYPADPLERSGVVRIAPLAFASGDGSFRRWLPVEETLYFPLLSPPADLKISGKMSDTRLAVEQGGAVTPAGRLFRWGPNEKGALATHPSKLIRASYPVEVLQVKDQVAAFATTLNSTCALLVNGKITCWGGNAFGELGRGAIDEDPHPEPGVIR